MSVENQAFSHPPADTLLPRLPNLRTTGKDKWMSCCPAHNDKKPSLSVRRFPDGSLSVKCFTGCSTVDVLTSVGLRPSDLFPKSDDDYSRSRNPRTSPDLRSLVGYLREDLQAVQIAMAQLAAGDDLTEADYDRLGLVALRISETLQASSQ